MDNNDLCIFKFQWTLNGLLEDYFGQDQQDKQLKSDVFLGYYQKWMLQIHTLQNQRGLSVTLHRMSSNDQPPITVNFSISILPHPEGGTAVEKKRIYKTFESNKGHGCFLVTKKKLLDNRDEYMPEGDLTIACEIYGIKLSQPSIYDHYEKLLDLWTKQVGDKTIEVGDKTFCVQSKLLSIYSDVFERMFTNDFFKEGRENKIKIEGDPAAVELMIKFTYTGEYPCLQSHDIAQNLLDLAEEFNIKTLKFRCLDYLMKNVSVNNAVSSLILADRYQCSDLRKITINFIKQNLKAVCRSDDYNRIPQQCYYLFKDIIDNIVAEEE